MNIKYQTCGLTLLLLNVQFIINLNFTDLLYIFKKRLTIFHITYGHSSMINSIH
jgi:hypothetical protein